jgi:hypothetical protein
VSDPKPESRIRDPLLLRDLHYEWKECALCLTTSERLSLHHICKHPRDDVRGNLVMLCGSGTTGCHGLVEDRDKATCALLGAHVRKERPDVLEHLRWRFGQEAAVEWLDRHLG